MAELDVQPKKRSVWPWVLIALVVLAILVFFIVQETDLVSDMKDTTIFEDSTEASIDTVNRSMDTSYQMPTDTSTMR